MIRIVLRFLFTSAAALDRDPHQIDVLTWLTERATLRRRSQVRADEEPATEARIVIAVRRTYGTILRACFRNQVANLAGRCDE